MTWAFWRAYCDEAHCLLGGRWLEWASRDYRFLGDLADKLGKI